LDDAAVYLVPIGSGRFDLYAEPSDDTEADTDGREPPGFWRRRARQFHTTWREISRAAYAARGAESGRLARIRDWLVRRIADSIAEQRTLWSLRDLRSASFVYPAELSGTSAEAIRRRLLTHARRHHGTWLLVNLLAAAVTALLILLPGPNLIGYYFAFRVIGHFLSWRGARQGLDATVWIERAEPMLTELGRLADMPRAEREPQVTQIAERLGLRHLAAFFDRLAVPAR
jgi:hypothetical protein